VPVVEGDSTFTFEEEEEDQVQFWQRQIPKD